MNEQARITVENHLYIKAREAQSAREKAIEGHMSKQYVQMWEDIWSLYHTLYKQVENMR